MTKSALTHRRHKLNRNRIPVCFQVLTAPAKEFKTINNSISRVIRVMITEPEDSV